MFRKRRIPAPHFGIPGAPFNPVTGQRAQMNPQATPGTILATFQVIGDDPDDEATQDTHENYVVCRGFEPQIDPFFRYLHDPKTKPDTTSIKVAKPYAVRGTYPYKQGQILVAARILTRLGANQGKAVTSVGHPADLDEQAELLLDDDDVAIAWLDISTAPKPGVKFLNNCGATYPAWGISRITGRVAPSGASPGYLTVAKVDATYRWQYFVNGPKDVANNKYGFGSYLTDIEGEALWGDAGASPAPGERWGPKADSFLLWQHRPGFLILGGTTDDGGNPRTGVKQLVPGEVRVKNDDGGGSLAAGASRTFGIYGGSGLTTDTGLEVTLKNLSSTTWETNKYGMASQDMGVVGGLPTER